jgi:hypothetical protein
MSRRMKALWIALCLTWAMLNPLVSEGSAQAQNPQPNWIAGTYTVAAGANNITTRLPPALYRYKIAWVSDRAGGAGFMVSNGTSWVSDQGPTGSTGPAGPSTVSAPNARTLSFATAYQATDTSKPAFVNVIVDCTTTVSLGSAQANTVELIIGPTNGVASGTGTLADTFRSDLSVSIIISLGWTGRQSLKAVIPAGYYFAVRRTVGTGMTIVSATDQSLG